MADFAKREADAANPAEGGAAPNILTVFKGEGHDPAIAAAPRAAHGQQIRAMVSS
jgi:hypothetical protein